MTSDLILFSCDFKIVTNSNVRTAAPGVVGGVVQHERGHPQRGGRRRPHLEHQVQENRARVYLPIPGKFISRYQVGRTRLLVPDKELRPNTQAQGSVSRLWFFFFFFFFFKMRVLVYTQSTDL